MSYLQCYEYDAVASALGPGDDCYGGVANLY